MTKPKDRDLPLWLKKLCGDVKPGQNAETACLKSHAADLSEGCKDAMAKAGASAK